ncbi:MAG: NAD(P)-dependent oxidoreductase [Saprospiraceae bacterium]|nr:NAD(P)-dependent oxidoreductase [Saprospiraceae bacterium]
MSKPSVIALIREGKVPPDRRVVFTPQQCREILERFEVDVLVEESPIRCFLDDEYSNVGIQVSAERPEADIYLGVKEVPIDQLVPEKTYLFFSHTMKGQTYNRPLLRAILEKNICLIDYEALVDGRGKRVAAFGYYAGVVGAHNTLYAYGKRTGLIHLPRMKHLHDYAEARDFYESIDMPPIKIVVTGTGRVGKGAVRVLKDMGLEEVLPEAFLAAQDLPACCFTVLGAEHYVGRRDGELFVKDDFYARPSEFMSTFEPYTRIADVFINAILWKEEAPAFFTVDQMAQTAFRIRTIGDITCDIAPHSSVPSTIRPSSIQDPVYGFDPTTGLEAEAYYDHVIDVMAIDNLPSELPRDAATAFGAAILEYVLPDLIADRPSAMIERATITRAGQLTDRFRYLQEYVDGQS